ncbi:hypothetical protein B0H17DRAFT_1180853 [Mycena rosella]|uniref:Transmembrane protein n=1 Tax=Mycena rosella TaxID=1033263 RepID=A0AAD7DBH4_MYCRO|nr:hypothetical protein B0H17DRAFT_1180853 [Mycena rosella]
MSLWNFTIDDTSPFLIYTPYGIHSLPNGTCILIFSLTADGSYSGLTNGWKPWYTGSGFISTNGEGGQGDSYHRTSLEGAAVTFEFYGTAVYLYGTANSSYDASVDNATSTHAPPTSDLLFSTTDLEEGTHSVTLTARPTSSSQQLAFDRAVVSAPLVNNQTPTEAFYDNLDTTVLKYAGEWGTPIADGIPNATVSHPWHKTSSYGASVSMDIAVGAVGVSLWGLADWGNWLYTVSIDGGAANQYNGSTFWEVPDALLFYRGGLDPTRNHTVSLINVSQLNLALNSIRVYRIESTQNATVTPSSSATSAITTTVTPSSSATSTVTTTSTSTSAHSSVSVGVIAGPVIGVLVLLALVGAFFWWRWRRNRSTTQDMAEIYPYTDQSPPRPLFPSKEYITTTSKTARSPPALSPTVQSPTIHSPSYSAPTPNATSTGLEAPDVDRLIELIAQRIDQGRGQTDGASPPEYRG